MERLLIPSQLSDGLQTERLGDVSWRLWLGECLDICCNGCAQGEAALLSLSSALCGTPRLAAVTRIRPRPVSHLQGGLTVNGGVMCRALLVAAVHLL